MKCTENVSIDCRIFDHVHTRLNYKITAIKNNLRWKKHYKTMAPIKAPIRFRRLRQSLHLKKLLFFKSRSIYFQIDNTRIIRPIKRKELTFSPLKSTRKFLPQSLVSHMSDSSPEADSSCCHTSETWLHLE